MSAGSLPGRRRIPVRRICTGLVAALGVATTAPLEATRICTVTVLPLAFGVHAPGTPTPVDSTAIINVSCTGAPDPGEPGFYTLSIDGGASGDPAGRYMLSAPNQLDYNLYQDAALTTIWGDGSSGTSPVTLEF